MMNKIKITASSHHVNLNCAYTLSALYIFYNAYVWGKIKFVHVTVWFLVVFILVIICNGNAIYIILYIWTACAHIYASVFVYIAFVLRIRSSIVTVQPFIFHFLPLFLALHSYSVLDYFYFYFFFKFEYSMVALHMHSLHED